jgi:hypothetical protein
MMVPLVSSLAASMLVFALADRAFERHVAIAAAMLFVLSPFAATTTSVAICGWDRVRIHQRDGQASNGFHAAGARDASRGAARARMASERPGAAVAIAAAFEILKALTPYSMRWVLIVYDTPFHVSDVSYPWSAMDLQLTWPAGAGVLLGVGRKDARTPLFIGWVLIFAVVAVVLTKRFSPDRFTVYWIPALCALAASTIGGWKSRFIQAATAIILAVCLGF